MFNVKDRASYWDVIVSNPPYIPQKELRGLPAEVRREPRLALDGGMKGLEVIDKILRQAPFYLKKDGFVLMEIGKGQSKAVAKLATTLKFYKDVKFIRDYNGVERIVILRRV